MSAGRGRRAGLGRGLATLIPERALHSTASGGPVLLRLPLDAIRRNPEQPRERFDEGELQALADSIRQHGLLSPVLVREQGQRYILVAGERRWRAVGLAGLTEIPALICEGAASASDQLLLSLVENLLRQDLDPVEEALALQRLTDEHGFTQEQVAKGIGRDRSTVTNALRLLRLPPAALDALRHGLISVGHGKALLSLRAARKLPSLLEEIQRLGLSVRATERRVAALNDAKRPGQATAPSPYAPAEDLLSRSLGSQVRITSRKQGGGRIIIQYGSEEELIGLVERMRGRE